MTKKRDRRGKYADKQGALSPAQQSIQALTEAQGHYILSIKSNIITFGIGPAGTGKTWVAAALAAEALENKSTRRVIITRPTEDAGRGLGFLPGELAEKFEPYFAPLRKVFTERLGASQTEYCLKRNRIEILPLEHMRGHTFDNAFVILDEAQNTTPTQMKLFLTRIGKHSTVVINGDVSQKDIVTEGLDDAVDRIGDVAGVEVVRFQLDDIVRSGIVREILLRYSK